MGDETTLANEHQEHVTMHDDHQHVDATRKSSYFSAPPVIQSDGDPSKRAYIQMLQNNPNSRVMPLPYDMFLPAHNLNMKDVKFGVDSTRQLMDDEIDLIDDIDRDMHDDGDDHDQFRMFQRKIREIEHDFEAMDEEEVERRRMLLDMSEDELRQRVMDRYRHQRRNEKV